MARKGHGGEETGDKYPHLSLPSPSPVYLQCFPLVGPDQKPEGTRA